MDYGSSLREKEENIDDLCCESSQLTVEHHQCGSQDSNNVATKMNHQACIGKPLPPQSGKIPASSKAAAAAAATAAILCQCIRGQSPTTEKRTVFWTVIPE